MKNINIYKWLIDLAENKPVMALLTVLFIAVGVLSSVIINRDRKVDGLQREIRIQAAHYEVREDSIIRVKDDQVLEVTTEFKEILLSNISDAKNALKEQQTLNQKLSTTITKAKTLIKKNRSRIKKIRQ